MAPQANHVSLHVELVTSLNRHGEARRHGVAFSGLRFVTPEWAPVPDVSYYRKERLRPESRRRFGKVEVPPDIAIEIVSPDQSVGELLQKSLRYAGVGIPLSLVVDADDETVSVVRPARPLQVLRGDDRIDLDDVLPGFDLTVRALFDAIVPAWLVEETTAED